MRAPVLLSIPLLLSVAAGGCHGGDEAQAQSDFATDLLLDGTPEAVGALRFLNDAATTLVVLDTDVPLPSDAATNLVVHRNGPDGVHGTSDDDPFDDVAEVIGVRQIGPARLSAIAQYAAWAGFVPQGDELLGTYDGVAFTADEAMATLALVNGAGDTELDVEIALDRRAVDSILAARPIATILQLSALYYVGPSALLKLNAWAASGTLADVGEDCSEHADCMAGQSCQGKPYDGAPEIGKCVPQGNTVGADDECASDQDCLPGLACAGLTVYGDFGFCRPLWMFGTYASTAVAVPIPDGDPAGTSIDLVVYGLATVPEDIMVTLDIDHPRPQDLVVTLVSTNGSDSVLWSHEASPRSYLSARGIERDNYINGTLTLHVVDSVDGEQGVLNGFTVWVSSRYD